MKAKALKTLRDTCNSMQESAAVMQSNLNRYRTEAVQEGEDEIVDRLDTALTYIAQAETALAKARNEIDTAGRSLKNRH